jgi:hypothetical protein
MERLQDLLSRLTDQHRFALRWFVERAGSEEPWPRPLSSPWGKILLASKAKGIYKPNWSRYALSVRQSIGGPYPDRDPLIRPDGSWIYSYFQENEDPTARDSEYTNRGLIECWHDRVPVGVMRQVSRSPTVKYHILGVALVNGWDGGYFFLEGFAADGTGRRRGPAAELELLTAQELLRCASLGSFDPTNMVEGRERIVAAIVRRQGQPQFRADLIHAYSGRCAISNYDVIETLEASHILPYHGPATNKLANGLLLRGDLHTLFDLGLIAVDSSTMDVLIAPPLRESSYAEVACVKLRVPAEEAARPSVPALDHHRAWAGL